MSAARQASLRAALAGFRQANGLRADEALQASWSFQIGPVAVRLPNFAWRRRAIEAHDLHHVLTGYPCTMRGEFQMAAWEFGAGPMPHRAAALFCLPLVLAGLLFVPRRTYRAFVAGRRSCSLHGAKLSEAAFGAPPDLLRAELIAHGNSGGRTWADGARFASLVLQAGLLTLLPLALLAGIWLALCVL